MGGRILPRTHHDLSVSSGPDSTARHLETPPSRLIPSPAISTGALPGAYGNQPPLQDRVEQRILRNSSGPSLQTGRWCRWWLEAADRRGGDWGGSSRP